MAITGTILSITPEKSKIGSPLGVKVDWDVSGGAVVFTSRIRLTDNSGAVYYSDEHNNLLGGYEKYAQVFNLGIMPNTEVSMLIELQLDANIWGRTWETIDRYTHTVKPTTEEEDPPLQQFQSYIPWILGGVAVLGVGYVAYKGFGRK